MAAHPRNKGAATACSVKHQVILLLTAVPLQWLEGVISLRSADLSITCCRSALDCWNAAFLHKS